MNSYNDFFNSKGIAQYIYEVDETKALKIFDSTDNIATFDFMMSNEIGEKTASPIVAKSFDGSKIAEWLLMKYYENWERIKNALQAEYDLLWTGGGERVESESYSGSNTVNNQTDRNEKINAFNGETASDSGSTSESLDGSSSDTHTITRRVDSKSNSVSYTQAEVVEKELRLRNENVFFDIVKNDIANELTLFIYDD